MIPGICRMNLHLLIIQIVPAGNVRLYRQRPMPAVCISILSTILVP
nr:MAG TPA: hypothetical protein [Caudoviricetes sp.]